MVSKSLILTLFGIFILPGLLYAQTRQEGPVIADYGAVWPVDNPDYKTSLDESLKVVFDIMNSPDSKSSLNASIETAARFLNMHAQAGVPLNNLKVALVVHNKASKDIMTSASYLKKYGVSNPNEDMVKALLNAGVKIVFCGQSSFSRDFPREETIEGVQFGLSAMTALIQLQNEGYRLVKF
ncbi:MAG: DsrE family protein [Muriicola sp.]|nr:DsrE family protein [Muriicola sp.]MBT8282858.1 DsrE family protein [Muriicola sp.]NNK09948.1 DsrE family protein [Flavobacteriaceae bacterium]